MSRGEITFSFGRNWEDYVDQVTGDDVASAMADIVEWLGQNAVRGKTVLDIGCGSGIHSLAFRRLGAHSVRSFDYDSHSVDAALRFVNLEGEPPDWVVTPGSILDRQFVGSLGRFDIVYSWGVLHHTGAMWRAMDAAGRLVHPGGHLWVSLYAKGPRYPHDLATKRRYNASPPPLKRLMVWRQILRAMSWRLRHFKNPLAWNQKVGRGMDVYHDIVDWLGGLPYEVAGENEVLGFYRRRGFILERIKAEREGGCSVYLFEMPASAESVPTAGGGAAPR
jgi:SAM-dependent methyltransferase